MGLLSMLFGGGRQSQAQQAAAKQAQQLAARQAMMQGIAMMAGNPQQPQYAPPYAAHPVTYGEGLNMNRGLLSESKRRKKDEDEEEEKERERRRRRQMQPTAPTLGTRYGGY